MAANLRRVAYAKLRVAGDENIEFLIQELPCVLGRAPLDERAGIVIDDDVLVSRKHVVIDWTDEDGWILTCLGRNSITVDDVKYSTQESAQISSGSVFTIGNNSITFHLPTESDLARVKLAEQSSKKIVNKKRPLTTAVSAPAPLKKEPARSFDEDDDDDFGPAGASGKSGRNYNHLPIRVEYENRETYQTMIEAAFASGELDLDEFDDSVLQPVLVDWIAQRYFYSLDEAQKQSLRKGVYNMLTKHYERVDSLDGRKRPQRGTIRWRQKKRMHT